MDNKVESTSVSGLATMASSIALIDNYNLWMIDKFRPYIGKNLLEVGIGQGNFRKYFVGIHRYLSVDIDKQVVEKAREKYPNDIHLMADISTDDFVRQSYEYPIDTVLCVNVVEHIFEDAKALANLLYVLSQGGHLLLFVPAFPSLYNDMDQLAGHYRRYTKQMLAAAIGTDNIIVLLEYFNSIGGVGWWANKFLKHNDLDSKQINRQVMIFDKYVTPVSKLINPLTKKIFGQSLICVVKKK